MKLWLVSQEETNGSYDVWTALVVAAESEEQAQKTLPFEFDDVDYEWRDNSLCRITDGSILYCNNLQEGWATRLENVKVKLLGDAAPGIEAGVILDSFLGRD
jgi:hypothetical protein